MALSTNLRSSPRQRLRLLGSPALIVDGRDCGLSLMHGFGLLAYLAYVGAPTPRTQISTLLWPKADTTTGRTRLRRLLYRLETIAAEPLFDARGDALGLQSDTLAVDALEFAARGREWVAGGAPAPDDEAIEAACLPLLQGVEFASEPFEEWRRLRVLEHDHLLARVLAQRIESLLAGGEARAAMAWAERLIALDRYCEPSYVALMRLHAALGNRAGVEASFMRCADELRSEFGSKPCADTEQAYLALMDALRDPGLPLPADDAPLKVRYAQSARGAVAYAAIGDGSTEGDRPALVLIPGFISHVEIGWEQPQIRAFLRALATTHTVLVFDRRGAGLSERINPSCSAEGAVDDVLTILDHAGITSTWLLGSSEGGPIALRMAAQHPERVRGVALFGAMAKGSSSVDYPWALPQAAFELWMSKMLAGWGGPADIEMFAPSAAHDPHMRAWWARMLRHATSPASMRATLRGLRDVDVRPLLPRITAPVLVLHRRGDRAVRIEAGRYLADSIPGAQWQPLDGDDHWWWCGDIDAILAPLLRFIGVT